MNPASFQGPLFIVGLPRSGTKLIRDLLNQNPAIGIPESETHFIPYWIEKFGEKPALDDQEHFDRFFDEFLRTPFYENMAGRGKRMTAEDLKKTADLTSWPSVLETILRYYSPKASSQITNQESSIWGDKSPGYVTHMGLLSQLFVDAKFLHIIRDPRDYALSVNNAWSKHLYLAADVWQRTLAQARNNSEVLGNNYCEIFYESLLAEPEPTLRHVCQFLGCDFVPQMLVLDRPSENLGDARGRTEIMQENTGKYHDRLTQKQIKQIEEIVIPVVKDTSYEIHYGRQHHPLSPLERRLFHLYDGLASVWFHIREKGLLLGLSYFYRLHVRSSWR